MGTSINGEGSSQQIIIMTDADMERYEKGEGLGGLLTDKGPLPLKALDIEAVLDGLFGDVVVTQTFVNNHAQPLEATYIFPLPDRAAVTAFRMEVGGRIVEGVLKERAAARQEYDEAMKAGQQAGITEEERPGVFSLRVGNIPPGQSVVVRLTMTGPLAYDAEEVTFRFPLVVAPRYIPGMPLDGRSVGDGMVLDTDAVPDASRITPPVLLPGYPQPILLSLNVEIRPAGLPLSGLRSSLHVVASEGLEDGTMRIRVQPGERLNRDFILRYQVGEATIQSSLTLVADADSASQEGTFALTIVPPIDNQQSKTKNQKARDVVFILDRSGSMDGWKMVAARRALGRMIDSLRERDRFSVLAFDDSVEAPELFGESLVAASDRHRFRVIEWLAQVEARGGTELAQPLEMAATQLAAAPLDRERVLVLLTDGQVGNEDQILQALAPKLKGLRIFTLGIDQAVNEAFLRRLAACGGGSCDVVESEDRLDEVMDKVQRRIGTPLWTGLRLEAIGLDVDVKSQVPTRLPDLFPGVPLTILGRYRHAGPNGQPKLVLHAIDEANRPHAQEVHGLRWSNSGLSKVWARGRLRDLEDRWVVGGHEPAAELQQSIVDLSLTFGVLCRFTAFVAVERSLTVNPGGFQQQIVQPVEAPAGWPMADLGSCGGPTAVLASFKSISPAIPSTCFSAPRGMDLGEGGDFVDSYSMCDSNGEEETNGGELHDECGEQPSVQAFVLDLDAYRQRAADMLREWEADLDLEHGLGALAIKLQELVEDLRSIGAEEITVEPLARLLEDIRVGTRRQGQDIEKIREVLGKFAESSQALGAVDE